MSELPNSKEPVLNASKPKKPPFGLPDWISKFLFSGLKNNQQPLLKLLVVSMFVMSFVFSLPDIVSYFERFEHYSFDQRQANYYENRTQSGISLLEMDENSLNSSELKKSFGRYPFRREIYGYLIRFLSKGKMKQLVMDMSFNGGEDLDHPASDQAFAQALSGNQNGDIPNVISNLAILNSVQSVDSENSPEEHNLMMEKLAKEYITLQGPTYRQWLGFTFPIVISTEAIDIQPIIRPLIESPMKIYPFQNLLYDINGKARRTFLFTSIKNKGILPTLPLSPLLSQIPKVKITSEGFLQFGNSPQWLNLRGEVTPIIRWYGNVMKEDAFNSPAEKQQVRVYPRYSFLNVIKSQVFYECQADPQQKICSLMHFKNFVPLDPRVFKDRYVMFGMNSISYDMDNHATLYDKNGRKYPGIYIQANILDNILHNDFIGRPGWRVPFPRPLAILFPAFETVSLVTVFTCLLMMLMTLRLNQWSSITLSVFSVVLMGISYNFLCHYAYEQWNLWLNWVYPMTTLMLSYSIAFVIRYVQTEKKKNQLRIAFGKYFPKDIMDSIIKNPDKFVRGQRLTMTFLFSDIRGFTWFAEHNDTELVQKTLNNYYTTLHQITLETKGTAFKFLGDGVLAFWGFPVQTAEDPIHAIHAALAMKKAVEAWGDDPDYPTIKIGIGINTGEAFFGNVGSEQYMDFTVIGDNVNIASRLQDLNKEFGTTIIISEATYEKVKDKVKVNYLGASHIRGKEHEVKIYELLALNDSHSISALSLGKSSP